MLKQMVKGWTSFLDPVIQYTASKQKIIVITIYVHKKGTCKIISTNTKKIGQNLNFKSYSKKY